MIKGKDRKHQMISFSIIVPVFNIENYIGKCLISIVNQTEKPYEVILIDDGSTDKTKEICDFYERKFPFIKVIHLCKRGGVSNARNRGLDIATGEYILFIDGDDEVSGFLMEALKRYIKQNKSELYIMPLARIKSELLDGTDSLGGVNHTVHLR